MRYNILLGVLLFFATSVCGQESEKLAISVSAPFSKGGKAFFASYLEGDFYAVDSAFVDADGMAVFKHVDKQPKGQYLLYILPDKRYELLLSGEEAHVSIVVGKDDSKATVTGSRDSELLWAYLQGRKVKDDKIDKLDKEILSNDKLSDKKRQSLDEQIRSLKDELSDYTSSQIKQNEGTWFAAYLKGLEQPVRPPMKMPTTYDEYAAYRGYMKEHYFDNIDLTDPAYWRTNYLNTLLDDYVANWIEEIPDSLAVAASRLVRKTIAADDYSFKRMLSRFVNMSQVSKYMGQENIWARLYEDYIKENKPEWISDDQYKELSRMYTKIEHSRIGQVGQNLKLESIDGLPINTDSIDADYLLVYFYDVECGHCLTNTPILHDSVYAQYKNKGFEVVAFYLGDNMEGWRKFIEENKLTDWVNAHDQEYKSEYWLNYDLGGTPDSFLLNREKVIIAKHMDIEGLKIVLEELYKRKNGTN